MPTDLTSGQTLFHERLIIIAFSTRSSGVGSGVPARLGLARIWLYDTLNHLGRLTHKYGYSILTRTTELMNHRWSIYDRAAWGFLSPFISTKASTASIVGCAAWLVGGTCTMALCQHFFIPERFAIKFCADVCFTNWVNPCPCNVGLFR